MRGRVFRGLATLVLGPALIAIWHAARLPDPLTTFAPFTAPEAADSRVLVASPLQPVPADLLRRGQIAAVRRLAVPDPADPAALLRAVRRAPRPSTSQPPAPLAITPTIAASETRDRTPASTPDGSAAAPTAPSAVPPVSTPSPLPTLPDPPTIPPVDLPPVQLPPVDLPPTPPVDVQPPSPPQVTLPGPIPPQAQPPNVQLPAVQVPSVQLPPIQAPQLP